MQGGFLQVDINYVLTVLLTLVSAVLIFKKWIEKKFNLEDACLLVYAAKEILANSQKLGDRSLARDLYEITKPLCAKYWKKHGKEVS